MLRFAVLDLPSNLGLRPSGVERLPEALRQAGLLERLRARDGGRVEPAAPYNRRRDSKTRLLNGPALRETTIGLGTAVASMVNHDDVPVVLAGDCSVVLGGVLGLRLGAHRVGLLFVDGHVDFYQPRESPTGEVADMDLALVTGRDRRSSRGSMAPRGRLFVTRTWLPWAHATPTSEIVLAVRTCARLVFISSSSPPSAHVEWMPSPLMRSGFCSPRALRLLAAPRRGCARRRRDAGGRLSTAGWSFPGGARHSPPGLRA